MSMLILYLKQSLILYSYESSPQDNLQDVYPIEELKMFLIQNNFLISKPKRQLGLQI